MIFFVKIFLQLKLIDTELFRSDIQIVKVDMKIVFRYLIELWLIH